MRRAQVMHLALAAILWYNRARRIVRLPREVAAMAKSKQIRLPIIRVKKGATRKEIYAKIRKAFTADDLARYLQVEDKGVPAEQLLAEFEAIDREERLKRTKGRKRA